MNHKTSLLIAQALALILWLATALATSPAFGQSAAIGYQGQLTEAGRLASGPYDMQFKLFDTAAVGSGAQKGSTIAQSAVPVANGVFAVNLDFGVAVFDGSPRFLEIGVRPGASGIPYTILAPRQQVASVPYAIQSLNAATAAAALTVASGSVVKSLNNLKDNVTLAVGPNATLTQTGNTLTIDAKPSGGGGGSSLWSLAGTDAYYNAGDVGIGTSTPTVGYRLEVNGATILRPANGFMAFGTPNAELGLSINPNFAFLEGSRADLRFDGKVLKLVAGSVPGPPPPENGLAITTAGNVGIGIASPTPGYRLDVVGATRLSPGNGTVQFGSPNAELGLSITPNAGNRADLRFDGSTLKLVAGPAGGPPSSANGIAITTAGSVGIGTTAPVTKLHVETSGADLDAVFGNATGPSGRGVVGNAAGAGAGVYGRSATGPAIHAEGNATQARDKGGFVKAMAYIDPFLPADRYVVRCYNSQQAGNAASTAPCGITVTRRFEGNYYVDFGFDVRDRFILVTPAAGRVIVNASPSAGFPNQAGVIFLSVDEEFQALDAAFSILVF